MALPVVIQATQEHAYAGTDIEDFPAFKFFNRFGHCDIVIPAPRRITFLLVENSIELLVAAHEWMTKSKAALVTTKDDTLIPLPKSLNTFLQSAVTVRISYWRA